MTEPHPANYGLTPQRDDELQSKLSRARSASEVLLFGVAAAAGLVAFTRFADSDLGPRIPALGLGLALLLWGLRSGAAGRLLDRLVMLWLQRTVPDFKNWERYRRDLLDYQRGGSVARDLEKARRELQQR